MALEWPRVPELCAGWFFSHHNYLDIPCCFKYNLQKEFTRYQPLVTLCSVMGATTGVKAFHYVNTIYVIPQSGCFH